MSDSNVFCTETCVASGQECTVFSRNIFVLTFLKMNDGKHLDLCADIIMSLLHSVNNLYLHADSVYLTLLSVCHLLSPSSVY